MIPPWPACPVAEDHPSACADRRLAAFAQTVAHGPTETALTRSASRAAGHRVLHTTARTASRGAYNGNEMRSEPLSRCGDASPDRRGRSAASVLSSTRAPSMRLILTVATTRSITPQPDEGALVAEKRDPDLYLAPLVNIALGEWGLVSLQRSQEDKRVRRLKFRCGGNLAHGHRPSVALERPVDPLLVHRQKPHRVLGYAAQSGRALQARVPSRGSTI